MSSVQEIEVAIAQLDLKQQLQLWRDLPAKLKFSPDDLAALKNAETAFTFWDNSEDDVYDDL